MSTSKTVFPGMDANYDAQSSSDAHRTNLNADAQKTYSTSYDGNRGRCGTFFPGMHNVAAPASAESRCAEPAQQARRKPLVGFLYSISRGEIGEYWPLYIGQNSVGASPKSDVYLKEATVSQDHALIVIRKMKNPEKVIASISDARSTNGTMINGVSLGFAAEECKNGDILTFGENYQCMLILIDVKELGLSVSESFIPVQDESEMQAQMQSVNVAGNNVVNAPGRFDMNRSSNATVGVDGETPVYSGGGTVGM